MIFYHFEFLNSEKILSKFKFREKNAKYIHYIWRKKNPEYINKEI
jgi:hypothetical protein